MMRMEESSVASSLKARGILSLMKELPLKVTHPDTAISSLALKKFDLLIRGCNFSFKDPFKE